MASPTLTPTGNGTTGSDPRLRSELNSAFQENNADLFVLEYPDLVVLWVETSRMQAMSGEQIQRRFRELTGQALTLGGSALAAGRDYGAAATDAQAMLSLARDLHRSGNIFGTYRIEIRRGRRYVVFRGRPGLRQVLTAPRYLETNPKVIRMGVGREASRAMARSGLLLTFVFSVSANTYEWLRNDEATFLYLLGNVATDMAKAGIATAAGYLAAAGVAAATAGGVIAVLPIAAGIAVGLAVGFALNQLDDRFNLTGRLVDAMTASYNQWKADVEQVRRDFRYYFGTVQGQMEFIRRMSGGF
jgi:hypothetical protein